VGISKFELQFFETRQLLEESGNILIYRPDMETTSFLGILKADRINFVEYHFNTNNQLYKIVVATGNKYIKESNTKIAGFYTELLEKIEKQENSDFAGFSHFWEDARYRIMDLSYEYESYEDGVEIIENYNYTAETPYVEESVIVNNLIPAN